MIAWNRRAPLKLALGLSLGALLAACASVLGIEERQEDSAANYPSAGYEGCRPGVGCASCLDVHQRECEVRDACAGASASDDCAACVCTSCLEPVVDCQLDAGCAAIWQCLKQSRCDLEPGAGGTCLDACSSVIAAHGGVSGRAFRDAAEIRTCAVASSCSGCLAPQPEPGATCNRESSCQDCPDCFRECLCSGERFGTCKELCGEEAPPATCTLENHCVGCPGCFELCTCGGEDYELCASSCQGGTGPQPAQQCSPESGCIGCADCMAVCACSGGSPAQCESQCAPPSPDDVCIDLSDDGESCGGCGGCIAECSCEGDELEDCMDECQLLACCDDQCDNAPMTACSCDAGNSADACGQEFYSCDAATSCSACACRNCAGKYALCQETPGCPVVFDCMRSTDCQGSACQERCGSVGSGTTGSSPAAFDVAEALWACDQANACECELPPPSTTVLCPGPDGDVTCNDYVGSNASLVACCPSTAGAGNAAACGLDLSRYLPGARPCEPLTQGNRPRTPALLELCPARTIFEPPYNGARLGGCCNSAANTCGVYDDITGLGCLKASVFGIAAQACNLLL